VLVNGRGECGRGSFRNHRTSPQSPTVVALAALEALLAVVDAPVFVLDGDGQVLHASVLAHAFLEREPSTLRRSLAESARGDSAGSAWKLTPLGGAGASPGFLAVLRAPGRRMAAFQAIGAATRPWNLTARQREVLDLVALGLTNADVGQSLGIGECTVEFHLSAIFDKVGVDNRATLIARLLEP
jgi:DNA-binding CsgD family transcriptional regulator